jgi:hypothetical protein
MSSQASTLHFTVLTITKDLKIYVAICLYADQIITTFIAVTVVVVVVVEVAVVVVVLVEVTVFYLQFCKSF